MKKGTHPICLFKYMKFLFIVVFLNKPTSNISKYPWLQLSFAKWQLSANFPQHAQRFHHFVHVFSPASPDFFPKKVPHFHPFLSRPWVSAALGLGWREDLFASLCHPAELAKAKTMALWWIKWWIKWGNGDWNGDWIWWNGGKISSPIKILDSPVSTNYLW